MKGSHNGLILERPLIALVDIFYLNVYKDMDLKMIFVDGSQLFTIM